MLPLQDAVDQRLRKLLAYAGVGGGAALLASAPRRTLAHVGDAAASIAVGERLGPMPSERAVHVGASTVVADLGAGLRLVVHVPDARFNPAFATRVERAATLLRRFLVPALLETHELPPSNAPPGAAPAAAQAARVAPSKRPS